MFLMFWHKHATFDVLWLVFSFDIFFYLLQVGVVVLPQHICCLGLQCWPWHRLITKKKLYRNSTHTRQLRVLIPPVRRLGNYYDKIQYIFKVLKCVVFCIVYIIYQILWRTDFCIEKRIEFRSNILIFFIYSHDNLKILR